MSMKKATEDDKELMQAWKEKAEKVQTKEEMITFIDDMASYEHDYGSIVHACFNAMQAAFNYVNRSPAGGITGFQAGCLGHMLIQEYFMMKPPYRLLDYNNLLYPQYAYEFEKIIQQDVWDVLQQKAKEEYEKFSGGSERVKAHLKSVADGHLPFGFQLEQKEG